MSIQKPIFCQTPPQWILQSPMLVEAFSRHIPVHSYPCRPYEVPIRFSFRGEILDGRLNGSGKLKLGSKNLNSDGEACLKVNNIIGKEIKELIGTFVDGLLHGNAKIVFTNGNVIIANCERGLFDGLQRTWDEQGNLMQVGFYQSGAKIGKSWSIIGKSLVYEDVSTTFQTVVIPFEESFNEEVLIGDYWPHIYTLKNVEKGNVIDISFEDKSCLIKIEAKNEECRNHDNYFFDIRFDKIIQSFSEKHQILCELNRKEGIANSEKLVGWYEGINESLYNQQIHQILLQMRQEKTGPESGPQLVSNVTFNGGTRTFNVTFFGKQNAEVIVDTAAFNEEGILHGFASLQGSKSHCLKLL